MSIFWGEKAIDVYIDVSTPTNDHVKFHVHTTLQNMYLFPSDDCEWGLNCQEQVSQAGISNHISQ